MATSLAQLLLARPPQGGEELSALERALSASTRLELSRSAIRGIDRAGDA